MCIAVDNLNIVNDDYLIYVGIFDKQVDKPIAVESVDCTINTRYEIMNQLCYFNSFFIIEQLSMSHHKITVSIVTYNSKNVVGDCINSIFETTQDMDIEIVVIDNCSEDGSAEFVKEHFPDIRVIQNRENVGFGKAHNQSFRISKGEYFLILNPDTVIFSRAINNLVAFMDSHNDVGVTGCKIFWDVEKNFMFPDLKIHSLKTALMQFTQFCRYFPNSLIAQRYWKSAHAVWKTETPINVEGITGGLIMVRRDVFESVGGFDEKFFLFFEEHDLLRRIKKEGWKVFFLPNAAVLHYFEESFRKSSLDIGKLFNQSGLYYYKKHYGKFGEFYLKSLAKINSSLLFIEKCAGKYVTFLQPNIEIATPNRDEKIIIRWNNVPGILEYLVEISYNLTFADRGGFYTKRNELSFSSLMLEKLPSNTGFLRILPVHPDYSTGKVIKVIKISK